MPRSRQTDLTRDRARRLRRDMTDVERRLWYALRDHRLQGWSFRRQEPIGPYFADFLCRRAHLVVELDGGQHGSPEGEAYDGRRDSFIRNAGYRVLRFWNSDVVENFDGVLAMIVEALSEGTADDPSDPHPVPPP